jgi:hypothetical protein
MPSIADVAKDLLLNPRPVLCLDTCELLGAVQCLPQGQVQHVDALFRLHRSCAANPLRVSIVITELVALEFGQNIAEVEAKAAKFLAAADDQSDRIHRAWSNINQPPRNAPSNHAATALVQELTNIAQATLGLATVIDSDQACVDRAVARVRAETRPSHKGKIKDSIHLEHYLELSRQLQNQVFQVRRVFVSSNKADFWQPHSAGRLHARLVPQFALAGLEFFGSLSAALGSLRI